MPTAAGIDLYDSFNPFSGPALAQSLLEAAPDGVVLVDAEGMIRLVNRRTETLFGYERSELLGQPVETLVPESSRGGHPLHPSGYAQDGVIRPTGEGLRLRARRRDGSEFPADIALSTLSNGLEGKWSVLATIRDVTNRNAPEQHLQVLLDAAPDAMVRVSDDGRIAGVNRRTEQLFGYTGNELVRDATARVELERELRRSIDRADTAKAAKSEFLSRMSHELRTPLNAVLGFAQILQLDELTDDQAEAVDQIVRAGQHLLELINEVLDIARIESGRLAMAGEPVSLAEALDEVKALIEPLARARQITIAQGNPEDETPLVLADRQRLKQVLLNIISNAVKYNRVGGRVDLEWSLGDGPPGAGESSVEQQAGHVRISVRDTGPGIAAEKLPRLFDPFDRLEAERTEVEGSGIGLAITLRLVEAMNGEISVASVPEQGTTITVVLPRAPADDGSPALPGPSAASGDGSQAPAKLRTALYLEDNLPNLRLMEHIFARRPGWRLVHALHGSLGVMLAQTQRPDVILLDLHLPDLPADVVLGQLRNDPVTRHVPVHIVTADADPEQRRELERAGVEGFVTKPIRVAEIYAIVDQLDGSAGPAH